MRKQLARMLSGILGPLGLTVQRTRDAAERDDYLRALGAVISSRIRSVPLRQSQAVCAFIFSKDRALQLHALLSSYRHMVTGAAPVSLLYAATTARHQAAYDRVLDIHRGLLSAVEKQADFRRQTLAMIVAQEAERIFFLVDDMVFTRPVDLSLVARYPCDSAVFSLRMGTHLQYCYTLQKSQPTPGFIELDDGTIAWVWRDGRCDWAYPLSLDGHVFDRRELLSLALHSSFASPNTLEQALQRFNPLFAGRYGICCREARAVNIPANRVQTDNRNRSRGTHQDALLEQWENGMEIDWRAFAGLVNRSAHEEHPFAFVKR